MSVLKSILKVVAPTVASALPGPLGPLAKKAVTDLLGLDEKASEEQIEEVLAKSNPETLEKLRKLDAEFKIQMRKLDVDLEQIASADRSSARQREVALRDWTPRLLGGTVLSGWVGVTAVMMTQTIPVSNHDIVMRSLGTLDMALGLVLSYYFGSSSGSRAKDETIAKLGNNK